MVPSGLDDEKAIKYFCPLWYDCYVDLVTISFYRETKKNKITVVSKRGNFSLRLRRILDVLWEVLFV